MGEEIELDRFSREDFSRYKGRLDAEMETLEKWFVDDVFSRRKGVCGLELEAWIIDQFGMPAPRNEDCIKCIRSEHIVPELAKFNIEINVDPKLLNAQGLRHLEQELTDRWNQCNQAIQTLDLSLLMVGILPTVTHQDLSPVNMSSLNRFRALNEQVIRARQGRPLRLEIVGKEHIKLNQSDVMLESAATSFQLHLQVPFEQARRYYNAAIVVSAPLVALSANSPYLFGTNLWDETRIPLFEQAVEVGGYDGAARGPVKRVTFGSGYVQDSLLEVFKENHAHYPILLPMVSEDDASNIPHVRLHNGTIWRWNRPLLGFDKDGKPHLRIEHRVMPAGPTVVDMIANAAFYYGLVEHLVLQETAAEYQLPFSTSKDNFYGAARNGLNSTIEWLDGKKINVSELILKQLLPQARNGLIALSVSQAEINYYLDIIEQRVKSGQNGATWQRQYVHHHDCDMQALTMAYRTCQRTAKPVHEWPISPKI